MTPRTFIVNSLLLARQSRFQSARSRKAIKTPGAQLFFNGVMPKVTLCHNFFTNEVAKSRVTRFEFWVAERQPVTEGNKIDV